MTKLIRELPRPQVNRPITSTTGLSAPICRYASRWFLPDLLTGPIVWLVNAPGTRHPALDLRAQAFPRQNHVSAIRANDSPPQPMTDATAALSPQTGFPATDEARTHLGRLPTSPDDGLRVHDPLRSLPATAALPATDEARTHLGRLPSSPDDVLRVHAPLRSLPATAAFPATDEARTHLGRLPSSPDDDLRVHAPLRSLPATAALPATDEARTHLGRLPSSPDDGLRVHAPLRSLPATATFPATDEARTHLGRKAPTCPPTTGLGPLLPLLPLPAVSPYPFPKRHTSPVMTNDRVSPLSSLTPRAKYRRNGSAIRQSISCGMPRRPARAYVRVFAAAS
ncbi:nitrogen fixation protein [Thalassospira sp. MBR-102]